MAAHNQQGQRVVRLCVDRAVVGSGSDCVVGGLLRGGGSFAPAPSTLAALLLDETPRCHGEQPGAGIHRGALGTPLDSRVDQRLLDGVLACVELAVAAHERPEDLRREAVKQVVELQLVDASSVFHRI
jgi:hypothetical protein